MNSVVRTRRGVACLAAGTMLALIASLGLARSGDSAHAAGNTVKARGSAKTVTIPPYSGPELAYTHPYPTPKKKKGYKFTVGYLLAGTKEQALIDQQNAAADMVARLGGKFIVKNGNSSVATQVANFNELIAQKVDAIIAYPINPAAFAPSLQAANAAHIPVVGIGVPGVVGQPAATGYATGVNQAIDSAAYLAASYAAIQYPGGNYVNFTLAAPLPSITYLGQRFQYWADLKGLKHLGDVSSADTTSTNQTGGAVIVARYPTAKVVFTFSPGIARDVSTFGHAQGLSINTYGYAEDSGGKEAIREGVVAAIAQGGFIETGQQAAIAVYDILTKQHLPLRKVTFVKSVLVTRNNVNKIPVE